jgi:catalase (peroxidase I)
VDAYFLATATNFTFKQFIGTPDSLDTLFVEELLQPRSIHDLERVRLGSDLSIANDNEMGRPMFQSFARDPKLFHAKFAQAFLKLCNLGWEGKLEKF